MNLIALLIARSAQLAKWGMRATGFGVLVGLAAAIGHGQSIEHPSDGFAVTVLRGGSSVTAVGVVDGSIVSAESGAPSVATVTHTATEITVSGVTAGTAIVTYGITGGMTRTLAVTVVEPRVVLPSALIANPIVLGAHATYELLTNPLGGTLTTAPSTSDASVATVVALDATHLRVTAIGTGNADITIGTSIGGVLLEHAFTVSVVAPYVSSPADGAGFNVRVGGNTRVVVSSVPSGGIVTGATAIDPAVASAAGAGRWVVITGVDVGTTPITYTTLIDGYTATNHVVATVLAAQGSTPQTITFPGIGPGLVGVPMALSASSDAGASYLISYAIVSGAGVLNGQQYTPTSPGEHTLRAYNNGDATYLPAFRDVTFTVSAEPITPVLHWFPATPITYGGALGPAQLNAVATDSLGRVLPGSYVYNPSADTMLHAGDGQVLSVTFTPADPLAYTSVTATRPVTVNKAQPQLSWTPPAAIGYGAVVGLGELAATADVPGSFIYTPAAGTVLDLGSNQDLSVTFIPTDSANYHDASAVQAITVEPRVSAPTDAFVHSLLLGTSGTYPLTTLPAGGTLTGTPVSSDPRRVAVSMLDSTNLRLTALGEGTAQIAITGVVGQAAFSHVFTVEVTPPYVSSPANGTTFSVIAGGNAFVNIFTVPSGGVVTGAVAADPAIASGVGSGRKLLLTGGNIGSTAIAYTTLIDGHTVTNDVVASVTAPAGTQAQTITFPAIGPSRVGVPIPLSATSDAVPSYLISYAVLEGTGTMGSQRYTPSAPGEHTLRAYNNGDGTYLPAYRDVTFTVSADPVVPTISWDVTSPIGYGQPLEAAQLNAVATDVLGRILPGSYAYSPAAGTVLDAGNDQVLSVTFTPADSVAYASATATRSVTVNKAQPGFLWSPPTTVDYGATVGSDELAATAGVPGAFVYTPAAGTILEVGGGQTLSVSFTPTDTTNYHGASATQTITVEPLVTAPTDAFVHSLLLGTEGTYPLATLPVGGVLTGAPVSSAPEVVTVSALDATSLRLTAVGEGTAEITITGSVGEAAFHHVFTVNVTPPYVTSPVNGSTFTVVAGGNTLVNIFTVPGGGIVTGAAAADPAIASGTGSGRRLLLTGGNVGTTTIVYTTLIDGYTATNDVVATVTAPAGTQAQTITFPPIGPSRVGLPIPLSATSDGVPSYLISYAVLAGSGTVTSQRYTPSAPGEHTLRAYNNGDGTYLPAYRDVTFTVSADPVVPTISWDVASPIGYGQPLEAAQLNAVATDALGRILPGSYAYSPAAGTVLGAGNDQVLSVTFTPADSVNYSVATATRHLLVAKASPILSWAPPLEIDHDTALSGVQLNASANIPGSFAYEPAAGTVLDAGDHVLTATFSPLDATNYQNVTLSTSISVAKATPTLSWPAPAAISYGTPLGAAQLNASANIDGTFVYTPTAGTVLNIGSDQVLTATFTPADTANYNSATASTTITVGKATPGLTWPAPAAIAYGTPLGAAQLNASASVDGTFVYAPAAGTVLNAGDNQALSVTFTPADTTNYNDATASTTIDVTSSDAGLNWDAPAAITYGTPLDATQLNATANIPGDFVYTPAAGDVLPAGEHELSVAFTPQDNENYRADLRTVTLLVEPAPLTVAANDATRRMGEANPPLTVSYEGLVNNDTEAVVTGLTVSTEADELSPVGTYPIILSGASATNYILSLENGNLTVTPAVSTVTLTIGAVSVPAGETAAMSALTARTLTFVADGGSGVYVWTIDGLIQAVTSETLTTSFLTPGNHTIAVAAAAGRNHLASEPAAIAVTISSAEFWMVAAGPAHILALKDDGSVWAWGRNTFGQLGDGTVADRLVAPGRAGEISRIIGIAAGADHSLAVDQEGVIWAWGRNDAGQLGLGTTIDQRSPLPTTNVSQQFVQIAAGKGHSLALHTDGTVWSWGANDHGQLGVGTTASSNIPIKIGSLSHIAAIAVAEDRSFAVGSDGTLWAWGANDEGQLGDGSHVDRLAPVAVLGISGPVTEIAAGARHTLALAKDGFLWSWGGNGSGQLGDGTTVASVVPSRIDSLAEVVDLAAGGLHSAVLTSEGRLWSWGDNETGQLGIAPSSPRLAPEMTAGFAQTVDLSAAGDRTVLLGLDGTIHVLGGETLHTSNGSPQIAQVALRLIPSANDSDQDGMDDVLELQFFDNLSRTGSGDSDGDGCVDVQELYLGTDPTDPYDHEPAPTLLALGGDRQAGVVDTFNTEPFDVAVWSADGLNPLIGAEVTFSVASGGGLLAIANTGSAELNTTLTGYTDAEGTFKVYYRQPDTAYITSEVLAVAGASQIVFSSLSTRIDDRDGNHLWDEWEEEHFGSGHPPIDPQADPDFDGLSNLIEMAVGTDPVDSDTDRDGTNDGEEYHAGRNPKDATDSHPLPEGYLLILKGRPNVAGGNEYIGLKADWTVERVNAP